MDFGRNTNMTPKSPQENGQSMIDMTILSTPRPQATSTVERRTFDSQCSDAFMQWRQAPVNTTESFSDSRNTSSLGLLNDISSRSIIEDNEDSISIESNKFETQRKMARQLLARLSEQEKQNSFETNKENNANTQNLGDDLTPSTLINSLDVYSPQGITQQKDKTLLSTEVPKISINSVVFEPNEITGRSSEKSKSPESSSKYKIDGFSFNSTAAELMAKFTNEDFISGSQMNSQLSADESSWQQNFNPTPQGTTEKERLEFSCFSGIMGDLDLSVGSCRKVSVDEFFRRKCEPIGQLSSDYLTSDRPNFGFEIKSPKRVSKPGPLVNLTMMSEASRQSETLQQTQNIDDKFMTTCTTNCIDDIRDDDDDDDDDDNDEDHEPLISLSGIAKALDSNDKTPRRLVDQLLMVKKKEKGQKEKKPVENGNCTSGTYTLTTARSSLPLFSLDSPRKSTAKLSLDSKNSNNLTLNNSLSRAASIPSSSFGFENKYMNQYSRIDEPETPKSTPTLPSPSFYEKNALKQLVSKPIVNNNNEEVSNKKKDSPGIVKPDRSIKREINSPGNIPNRTNTSMNKQKDKLSIGKNSEGLYKCIIGVSREAEIEMINESDRWLVCTLNLMQIQGDKNNVHLEIPQHEVLIEPSKGKTVKILVKLLKMTGPVLAALSINCNDMTTRESFTKQHMMCFIPANAQVDIICPPGHFNQLNFSINNNLTELPVTLHNNYDTDIPLELSVSDGKGVFNLRVQNQEETASKDNKSITYLILKANEKSVINVEYKGMKNPKDSSETIESSVKLIVRVFNDLKNGAVLGEIPLIVEAYDEDKEASEETKTSRNHSRCDTPQQQLIPSLPSSPHSVSSSTSAGTSASACNKSGRASPRSLSSGVTVSGDMIPIQSTHSSLSWTTVRVGKYEKKEFTIRNTSNNKIKLQAIITDSDKSFKFLKDRESSTSIIVGLQRLESRTLSVVFSPNQTGALAGKITFMHYENKIKKNPDDSLDRRDNRETRPSRIIMLYGYGGYARVNINQALKIMAGQMWLSLGQLSSGGSLNSKVQLQNLGDLPAYAKIKLTPKAVYPTMETSWHVEPTEFILGPKQSRWITIEFKPRKEDIALLKSDVADMGTLTITHGDEPTRWRIRRVYQKLIETGQINKKENDVFKNVVDPICKKFPGEVQMPNLSIIRDSVQELGVLCRNVNRHVVTLMMELNSDETLSIFTDDGDESEMFQSLCSDTSVVFINNEDSYMPSESLLDKTVTNDQPKVFVEEFTVSPSVVTLNPPGLNDATVMITSNSSTAQPFETKLLNNDYLSVLPIGGMIPAKRGVLIKIQCKKNIDKNFESALEIFTSNERRTVKIKVISRRY